MSITKITTHNANAIARLLYQYRDSTKLQSLITALYGTQVQEIEDAVYGLTGRLDIDTASGIQLDGIGSIVGQSRLGLDDFFYRIFLKARIGKNVSEGDIERILSVWKLFDPDATSINLQENFPAEVAIVSNAPILGADYLMTDGGDYIVTDGGDYIMCSLTSYAGYIDSFMQDMVGAGIKFGYSVVVATDDSNFGFVGSSGLGFGDTADPDVGGIFSYIEL